MPRRILCIWLPHWPLQRLMVARPELKGRPVVLTELHPRGGERVVHASRAAAALGVRAGMSVAEAVTLVGPTDPAAGKAGRRVPAVGEGRGMKEWRNGKNARIRIPSLLRSSIPPSLTPFPADPIADRDALTRLAYWCHRYSPTVGLEEAEPPRGYPESLLLDVTGIGRLFGGEKRLLEEAAGALSARGYRPRLTIAETIGAAWAFAHYACARRGSPDPAEAPTEGRPAEPTAITPTPDLSPIQREGKKEGGIVVSNSSSRILHSALRLPHSLPLAALRLPVETIDLLAQLGIHSVEQLAALPREGLDSRFGPLLLRRLDQATGAVDEVIQPLHPPPDLSMEWLFETPTAEPEVLHTVLEKLLARLAQNLAASGRGATQLTCRFDLENGPPLLLDVGLYRPTATAKHLHELLRMQLDQSRLRGPVESMTVIILAVQPLVERQQELFASEHSRTDHTALARLIDRLAGRLGHRGVVRPRLVEGAQPELAIRYEPLVGDNIPGNARATSKKPSSPSKARPKRTKQNQTRRDISPFEPLDRPLTLLPRPAPIRVISLLPDGPPAQFVYRGRMHRVARHWGPERIETGWWRKTAIRRDYWRAETTTGARYWLFRHLRDLAWFLHGVF